MENNPKNNPDEAILGKVAVVTDSVAQVPEEMKRGLGITSIPFSVIVEGKSYQDEVDIKANELYRRMRTDSIVPKTSQPSSGEFLDTFRQRFESGAKSILYLSMSSKLSGAYNTALETLPILKKEYPDRNIEVYDTRSATIAQGFMAIEVAKAAMHGLSLEQLVSYTKEVESRVGFIASLDTLKYLARGGRIGKLAYMMGEIIHVKPVVTIGEDGVVMPISRVRGETKAHETMVNWVRDRVEGKKGLQLAVMEGDVPHEAEELGDLAVQLLKPEWIIITPMTPVIGVHAGHGVIGLAYYFEESK